MKIEKEVVERAKQKALDEGVSFSTWMANLMKKEFSEEQTQHDEIAPGLERKKERE